MKIAIDLRSLHTSEFSGVESYTVNVLEHLLRNDHQNSYTLYYNGFWKKRFDYFHFINAKYKQTRIPNRLLNLSLKLFNRPNLESLIGDCDVLFMPNWNLVSLRGTTKLILTVHDLSPLAVPELFNPKGRLWHRVIGIRKLINRANIILATSEFTKSALIDVLKVPEHKITVAQLGVDQEAYHPELSTTRLREVRNRYGLPGDFIFYVGTIEPRKNLERVIEAFERLPGNESLLIAGKWGWKFKPLMEKIRQSPKRRKIQLMGYVSEADKPYIMKLARMFVWPSLYEGFGLPALEAMAVGTPVLTSNVTSLPEVVGEGALMVNPYNVDDIAQGMETLLRDEQVRKVYIQKGLEQARQFTWEKTAAAVQEVMTNIRR